ncbi:MAG: hypothetical protein EAX89_10315 [Candidatus Lokiarchaeota archaeon]|nr:hypothetical protein [Candidatus Lokiarchaeota archaeon]
MSERMNVLFIITDQHRSDHLGCYGNSILKTPNIDKFANESVRFSNAFCTNPMCMPNRATLLTGYYPNVHGVRSNGINLPWETPTITKTLASRGYHTINIGKMHLNYWTPPYSPSDRTAESFDDWKVENPKGNHLAHENFPMPYYGFQECDLVLGHSSACIGHYLNWLKERAPDIAKSVIEQHNTELPIFHLFNENYISEELYNTTYIKDHTISFLERYVQGRYGNKPFFLHCSFPDPHHPVSPPGKYKDMYSPEDIELPASFHDIERLYKHPYMKTHLENPPMRGGLLREETEQNVKRFIALNYGAVSLIDHAVGKILASLNKLGLSENTMVIFTSDHGDYMGDHGITLKGPSPFNGTLQIPLIWKVPGISKPSISNALISSIDIPKTILELLSIKERYRPPQMQGYDMTPVLKNESEDVRDCILITEDEEVGPKGPLYTRLCHLITKDYKLTKYAELPHFGDIYHRKRDKDELYNLWNRNKDLKMKLVDKLFHEYMITRSRFPIRQGGT